MKKATGDPKIKKTLVRNYEMKAKPSSEQLVVHDVACSSNALQRSTRSAEKENVLTQPSLCSSNSLANYLTEVKNAIPPTLTPEDLNVNKELQGAKVTKKLNFHFNDKIYKNLIELNSSVEEIKIKRERRPKSVSLPSKKDLEPHIEDFYEDIKEIDSPPHIPVTNPKFKPIKKVEDGRLHKLVAMFENL